jgi:hypothetical protein
MEEMRMDSIQFDFVVSNIEMTKKARHKSSLYGWAYGFITKKRTTIFYKTYRKDTSTNDDKSKYITDSITAANHD